MTTPLTPSPEAVEAAARQIMSGIYLMVGEDTLPRKAARDTLTAAMPHIVRQIRADVIAECVGAIERDTRVAINLGSLSAMRTTPEEIVEIAVGAVRALLPAPTPAPEEPSDA